MSGELNAEADSPVVVAEEEKVLGGRPSAFSSPIGRRSFLKCALASGAALTICDLTQPLVAISSGAAPQKQDDSRFTVEAKFYQKLQNKKIKCKLCPRECTVGDKDRILRCARKSQRDLLHAGALASVCRAY